MIRVVLPFLLALCVVFASIGAGVAQTRMVAAGSFCGTGAAQILLDATGLPVLDANGAAIAAPDCPACTLTLALSSSTTTAPTLRTVLRPTTPAAHPISFPLDVTRLGPQARAPPALV